MNKKLPIGVEDFKTIINNNSYFVDKTFFIKDIIDSHSVTTLITRPRRFGKTLNMSMLYYFFNCREDNSNLFDGLFISKQSNEYMQECGKYPTVFITFRGMEGETFNDAISVLKDRLITEFEKNRYILESNIISPSEKARYIKIVNKEADIEAYKGSLLFLSDLLERYHGNKVIILIDEYDKPIQISYLKKYYAEYVNVIKGLFENTFKTNTHLQKGILTGILRVAKEGLFSGLNNLEVCGVTERIYSNTFGFTQGEVDKMFAYYKLGDKIEKAKSWYNGYNYGGHTIYNPWAIINYCKNYEDGFKPYWTNSGSTEILEETIKNIPEIRESLVELLDGRSIKSIITDEMIYTDIQKGFTESVYSLLLYTGYLKVKENINNRSYILEIPNKEIKFAYNTMLERWSRDIVNNNSIDNLLQKIFTGNIDGFKRDLQNTFLRTFSYFDKNKAEPEIIYQAFFIGVLTQLNQDMYVVRSNRESGYGRYDICVYPKPANPDKAGIIIEFKTTENIDDLETNAKLALKQIDMLKYDTDLKDCAVTRIVKIGIAFHNKRIEMCYAVDERDT